MAQRKPYNPNTKYGRKKLREQAMNDYANSTPEEKAEKNITGVIILIVICIVMFLILGPSGFVKWMQR